MRSCCKLFWCFKMYLKQIFFERYLIGRGDKAENFSKFVVHILTSRGPRRGQNEPFLGPRSAIEVR